MKCKEAHKQFLFLADDLLSETAHRELKQHIENCNDCELLYGKITSHYQLLAKDKIVSENPFFYSRLEKSIAKKSQTVSKFRKLQTVIEPIILAAVIVLGLFIGIFIGNNTQMQADNDKIKSEVESVFNLDDNELAYESVEGYLMENQ